MLLAEYDVILINSSAGKDSLVMLDILAAEAQGEGVLDRCVVVHADLGRVEWGGTKDLAKRQADRYGIRFEEIARPQGDLLDHVEARQMWPSSKARFCTSDHKRGQVAKIVTRLTDEVREQDPDRQVRILNCIGYRWQESPARKKKVELVQNNRLTNGKRIVDDYHPILAWDIGQVWEHINLKGLEYHPAYDYGMPRLSCVFCIFAPKSALLTAGYHNPDLLAEYVRTEEKIGHQFTQKLSIKSIQEELAAGFTPCESSIESWAM